MSDAKGLVELLRQRTLTVAAAESCTGGAFMAALVRVPGASEVLRGGVVAYSLDAKVKQLGVNLKTIERHGAVSEQVAAEMAVGVKKTLGADIGVGITGFAGPSGERVGEICFAVSIGGQTFPMKKNFPGLSREEVIDASVNFLLQWLCEKLL